MKRSAMLVSSLACLILVIGLRGQTQAEPLTLQRAVQLALSHSSLTASSEADAQRAFASYREAKNQYIPQLSIGSGLGKAWGYPLSLEGSAPAIFNVNTQSAVYNPALRDFVRAAHSDWQASAVQSKDQRNQVIQDTVLSYAELTKWMQSMLQLQQQQEDAVKVEGLVSQRVKEGVESPLLQTRAKLATARVRLRMAEAHGAMDVLRKRLSDLTGLPADSIDPVADSVPALPEVKQDDPVAEKAAQSDPTILAADIRAIAEKYRARGEHRALWPTADFAGQYALLSTTLTDYQQFFQPGTFQKHNGTVGLVLRLNFLNEAQRARAKAADAAAIRAQADARAARNKVSEETLRLQRSVEQLAAAQQVADLEYQVTKANAESSQVRLDAGSGSFYDAQDAREQADARYNALQDANFELDRARIALLRATGALESWLSGQK